jgi:hypothetical protein
MVTGHLVALTLLSLAVPAQSDGSKVPAWTVPLDEFVGLLDARGVTFIKGRGNALFLEAKQRWLCLRREKDGIHCYPWPAGAPRPYVDLDWNDDRETRLEAFIPGQRFEMRVLPTRTGDPMLSISAVKCMTEFSDARMPPSRRPKPHRKRCDRTVLPAGTRLLSVKDELPLAIARAFAELPTLTNLDVVAVTSVEHDGSSLVSIGETSEAEGDSWTCQRSPGLKRSCRETQLSAFDAINPASTLPQGWLLDVNTSQGRGGSSSLVWVSNLDGRLTTAALAVGGTAAYGGACDRLPGYCVDITGHWTPWEMLSPTCVKIGPTVRWHATHVRAQERWINEEILPPPKRREAVADDLGDNDDDELGEAPAPGTYRPSSNGWQQLDCGPGG